MNRGNYILLVYMIMGITDIFWFYFGFIGSVIFFVVGITFIVILGVDGFIGVIVEVIFPPLFLIDSGFFSFWIFSIWHVYFIVATFISFFIILLLSEAIRQSTNPKTLNLINMFLIMPIYIFSTFFIIDRIYLALAGFSFWYNSYFQASIDSSIIAFFIYPIFKAVFVRQPKEGKPSSVSVVLKKCTSKIASSGYIDCNTMCNKYNCKDIDSLIAKIQQTIPNTKRINNIVIKNDVLDKIHETIRQLLKNKSMSLDNLSRELENIYRIDKRNAIQLVRFICDSECVKDSSGLYMLKDNIKSQQQVEKIEEPVKSTTEVEKQEEKEQVSPEESSQVKTEKAGKETSVQEDKSLELLDELQLDATSKQIASNIPVSTQEVQSDIHTDTEGSTATMIDDYIIVDVLSKDDVLTVYLGKDKGGKQVLIREFNMDAITGEEIEMIYAALNSWKKLKLSSSITPVLLKFSKKPLFYVTDYIKGNIETILEDIKTTDEALDIFFEIAKAIDIFHTQTKNPYALIDLTNILVNDSNYLLDNPFMYKVSKLLQQASILSPQFMAPEQRKTALGPISEATDVWQLGVLLYVLVTKNKSPWGVVNLQIEKNILNGTMENMNTSSENISKELMDIIRKMTAVNPNDRLPLKTAIKKLYLL